jgi:hypothetical protein
MHSSFPHSCYMPRPSHPPWLDHSNYTWRRIQVMKQWFKLHNIIMKQEKRLYVFLLFLQLWYNLHKFRTRIFFSKIESGGVSRRMDPRSCPSNAIFR